MDIVKKNLVSIIFGVLAIAAVVASVYPLNSKKEDLTTQLQGRAALYSQLDGLINKPRNKPILNPENTTPEPLGRFPNDDTIEKGKAAKAQFDAEGKKILDSAIAMNKHEPLARDVLPTPKTSNAAIQFRFAYKLWADSFAAKIHAGMPPSETDIATAADKLYKEKYEPQKQIAGATASQALEQAFANEKAELPDRLRQEAASKNQVYLDPNALGIDQNLLKGTGVPDLSSIWYAQLGVWVTNDVGDAIVATNNGSHNVAESPVKHILKISLRQKPYVLPAGSTGSVEGDPNAAVPKAPDASPTGRVTNPLYDVIDFDVVVNVEADKMLFFLKELSDNRFISVLNANVTSVDSGAQQAAGYFYGDKPVVQLTLQCEEIMFRDWSHKLMPDVVAKNMSGDAVTGGAPSGGGAGGGEGPGIGPGSGGAGRRPDMY